VGVFLVTSAVATVVVVAAAVVVMVVGHPGSSDDPLALAVAQVATGKSGKLLMQEREEIILDNAAAQKFTVTSVPAVTTTPSQQSTDTSGTTTSPSIPTGPPPSPSTVEAIAYNLLGSYGFATSQWTCLDDLWQQESGWDVYAENASGAYGIPQALPGSKMASAGPDWESDATTQIKWGLGYIQSIYGTPCGAWDHEEADGWY
jgi:hypothetical protein